MRNLLAFGAVALLTFAGLGWYLDWYSIRSGPAPDGHREVKINFNTGKIGEDLERGGKAIRHVIEKAPKDKTPPAPETPPQPDTPPKFPKKPGISS